MTPEEDRLNVEAFLALEGGHKDIARTLIVLLRSDAPIAPIVRERLAEALSKTKAEPGIRLEVRGEGPGKRDNHVYQLDVRRRWIEAGQHIEGLMASGMTNEDAKRHVTHLGIGSSQASNVWRYYQKARGWVKTQDELRERFVRLFRDPDRAEAMLYSLYNMDQLEP